MWRGDDQALGHRTDQLGMNLFESLCTIIDPCDLGYYSLLIGWFFRIIYEWRESRIVRFFEPL